MLKQPIRLHRRATAALLSTLSLIVSTGWASISWAASPCVTLTTQVTAVPNSYQVTASISNVPAGDIVDIQIYSTTNDAFVDQFYTTAPGGDFTYVVNTPALPPHQSLAYRVYVKTANWTSNIYGVADLAPFQTTAATPTLLNQALVYYPNWRRQYVQAAPQGLRVVNPENDNVTVSEGQGYGMLIAALAKDRATFAGLWQYAQAFLDRNGLMNWEISSAGQVIGATSATNGDETMAEALLIAGAEWPGHGYHQAGVAMAQAIYAHDLIPGTHLIGPGDGWPATNQDVAPGYIDPYAYQLFATATGNSGWQAVLTDTEQWLASTGANAATGLVPDWETVAGGQAVPSGSQNPTRADDYYENAVPYPLWLAQWAEQGGSSPLITKLATFFQRTPMSDGYTLTGTPLSSGYVNMPFVSGIAALLMATDPTSAAAQQAYQALVYQQANTYYGSILKALALFVLGNPTYPVIRAAAPMTAVSPPPRLPAPKPETVTVGPVTTQVIGNLGPNPPQAIRTSETMGYIEERAAIEAGASLAGEGLDSSYLTAILSGAGVGLQRHVSAMLQGQLAALYQKLGIILTWPQYNTDYSHLLARGVHILQQAKASPLAIENYLVMIGGFSWAMAQLEAAQSVPI